MSGVNCKCAARDFFGTTVLAIFLEAKRIHSKAARVIGRRGREFRQNPGDTIAQHPPMAEAKVKRMCDDESENIARPVDQNGAVTFDRKSRIPIEPSPCGQRPRTRTSYA